MIIMHNDLGTRVREPGCDLSQSARASSVGQYKPLLTSEVTTAPQSTFLRRRHLRS